MGNISNKEYNIEDILNYGGNEKEFTILNEELNQPFEHQLIFEDNNKTILKYMGQLENRKYEGRGILYSDYTYDGYFQNGLKHGYFRVYKNNSKILIYQGYYNYDKYHGKGILYNDNGEKIYDGYFENGEYNGLGIEYFQEGKFKRKLIYEKGKALKESLGILYYENNIVYKGLLKNFKPECGKNLTIYGDNRNILYIGDFNCFEYNGKGVLYFINSDKKYFDGFFDTGSYTYGTLFDPEGNQIYEGEFMNDQPKEVNNINLFHLNGKLKFTGDLKEGKYQGHGKLYKNDNLLYEGNFKDGYCEGNGILYIDEKQKYEGLFMKGKRNGLGKIFKEQYLYFEGEFLDGKKQGEGIIFHPNKQKYLEGNFEEDKIKGKFIKYYDNGSIKIEANYKDSISCNGKYYSPDNELLFEGDIIDDIPCTDANIKIYNDYTYKIYIGEMNEELYNVINAEYFPKYYISEKLNEEFFLLIPFLSFTCFTGKTTLIHRIIFNTFKKESSPTIGFEMYEYKFKKNNHKYNGKFYDCNGTEGYKSFIIPICKKSNFFIFTLNIHSESNIDETFIDSIRSDKEKESIIIYFIGNKMGNPYNNMVVDINRNRIKDLIRNNKIDKYFEVNAKTGEGFDILRKNINFDIISFSKKNINY